MSRRVRTIVLSAAVVPLFAPLIATVARKQVSTPPSPVLHTHVVSLCYCPVQSTYANVDNTTSHLDCRGKVMSCASH
ncbi:hypothetical protein GUJ93_ZPchr0003g17271 [Zizania palustris]|uniref:Secreted protein n=1 Tax=Zizania palustris TaxID=103762 RepID=A0A8J5SGG8_ZIZPA|nr:hypothetical protein GUJ93_ZPchr0003g17271 [Zizania palustris]